eukprot:CAMPEP_0114543274 /NCGR_PEP_ID=MMETSP0114-20121206/2269_1 /TAXON_ID=31324 /ORGANISM="Goniomonas sp, Strain m" /LENGTH=728 /DNA_ID=CAMNT_0001727603 /DNA_START=33 /DNA_END=2217 /DNA_ORIENTATION=-
MSCGSTSPAPVSEALRHNSAKLDILAPGLGQTPLESRTICAPSEAAATDFRSRTVKSEPATSPLLSPGTDFAEQASRRRPSVLGVSSVVQDELMSDKPFDESKLMELLRPSRLRWKKGALIGRGSFGSVYLGLNLENGSMLAVKEVFLSDADPGALKELLTEARILCRLSHPNVVRMAGLDIILGNLGKSLYILMEYVPGGSLDTVLGQFGPLDECVAAMYTQQALRGLEYLHENGIVHRDIKPANLLIDDSGTIKVADFGTSRVMGNKTEELHMSVKGTPVFMAPELIRQTKGVVGRRADIWSLACTVLNIVTGKLPWAEHEWDNPITCFVYIGTQQDAIPQWDATVLSPELCSFLSSCLVRDSELRPTAHELLDHSWFGASLLQSVATPKLQSIPGLLLGDVAHGVHELKAQVAPDTGATIFSPTHAFAHSLCLAEGEDGEPAPDGQPAPDCEPALAPALATGGGLACPKGSSPLSAGGSYAEGKEGKESKTPELPHDEADVLAADATPATPGDNLICCHCRKAITDGEYHIFNKDAPVHVHSACRRAFVAQEFGVCAQCGNPVCAEPGRFGGSYSLFDDGSKVHSECREEFLSHKVERCCVCKDLLMAVEGRFSGAYTEFGNHDKVHAECRLVYVQRLPKCAHCHEPVAKMEGKFCGNFFQLPDGKSRVHRECMPEYRRAQAPKCAHCSDPILRDGGGKTGKFYDAGQGAKSTSSAGLRTPPRDS